MTEKHRCDYVFRVQNVCDDIPGVGHLLSSFIPTPGNLPPKTETVLMPGGEPGRGLAQLELTDALGEVSALYRRLQNAMFVCGWGHDLMSA